MQTFLCSLLKALIEHWSAHWILSKWNTGKVFISWLSKYTWLLEVSGIQIGLAVLKHKPLILQTNLGKTEVLGFCTWKISVFIPVACILYLIDFIIIISYIFLLVS